MQGYYLRILDQDFNTSRQETVTKMNSIIHDGERQYTAQNLKPYSMVEFTLQAYTSAGSGPISRPVVAKLLQGSKLKY